MRSFRRLTGVDIAFSLRDRDESREDLGTKTKKFLSGLRLLFKNQCENKTELHEITGWDTLRVWRYSTSMLATKHNVSFMESPSFRAAYDAAVEAANRDHWNAGMHFRVHQALWCAGHGMRLGGNLIELGTGRGMIFSAILTATPDWEQRDNQVFLFDTFSSASMNMETGFQDVALGESPVYAVSYEATRKTFERWSRITLVKGNLPETLSEVEIGPISFLHIDLNSHIVESECLMRLWNQLVPGAIVLLDDYAHVNSEKQYHAMNSCAEKLGVSILTLATGQGLIIRP